jgi:integrase/recombinase XerD
MNTADEMTIQKGFEKFIQRKKIANLSEASFRYYNDVYKIMTEVIAETTPCVEICESHLFEFINYIRGRNPNIRDTSVNSYLRGIRAIFYFFMEEGYTPKFNIKLIKAEKTIRETYTTAELERLLKKPNIKACSFAEYRNWVIVCYLLGTGNRERTVCNVKIGDLDFDTHEIKLTATKNKKQYIIPMSRVLERTLSEYLEYRKGEAEDYLFCNIYGQQMKNDTLTSAIKRFNHSRGVVKTSIHLFRHTFAKNWILNNGDIFRLQKLLGHSSIEIVKEYVNMFGADLQKNFDVFNPLDNMEIMKRSRGAIQMNKDA